MKGRRASHKARVKAIETIRKIERRIDNLDFALIFMKDLITKNYWKKKEVEFMEKLNKEFNK